MNTLIALIKDIGSNEHWSHRDKKDLLSMLRQYIIWEISSADATGGNEDYQELVRQAQEAHSYFIRD